MNITCHVAKILLFYNLVSFNLDYQHENLREKLEQKNAHECENFKRTSLLFGNMHSS